LQKTLEFQLNKFFYTYVGFYIWLILYSNKYQLYKKIPTPIKSDEVMGIGVGCIYNALANK